MIDITHIALFTPTACILSFVAKYYLDHRRRETSRGVYMTVSYVTAIAAIACFAVGVYVLFAMDSIIVSHAFLANMSVFFLVANCFYQPADVPLPKEKNRFVLSQHLGVGMRTTIGRYPSIARAMLAASYTIRTEPESHLVITDLDDKKIVVINPPNSLN